MDAGIDELQRALIDAAVPGADPDVLGLAVFRPHAAEVGEAQAAVALDLRDHAAQGVRVGLQQQGVVRVFAAEVDEHAALHGAPGVIAQGREGVLHPLGGLLREARGAVDGQQGHGLAQGQVGIASFQHGKSSFDLITVSRRHSVTEGRPSFPGGRGSDTLLL